jgi:hypothetical protein
MSRIYLFCSILLLASCTEEVSLDIQNPKIKAALDKKIATYKIEMAAQCRKDIINRASMTADSIVSVDNIMNLAGLSAFPDKPPKPDFPGAIIIKDTIKAVQIFDLNRDSIQLRKKK